MSIVVLGQIASGHGPYEASVQWFSGDRLSLEFGECIARWTPFFICSCRRRWLCRPFYSHSYMTAHRWFASYYACQSLFTASMLNLVIADNLFQLLVGWELVG